MKPMAPIIKGFLRISREKVIARGSHVRWIRIPGLGELSWFLGWYGGALQLNFFLFLED